LNPLQQSLSPDSYRVLFIPRAPGAKEPKRNMADFIQSANARSATRTLAEPIVDVTTFNMVRVEDPKQEKVFFDRDIKK